MAKEKAGKAASKKSSAKAKVAARAVPPEKANGKTQNGFKPDVLDSTIIALPLLEMFRQEGTDKAYEIIIDVNRDYPGGRDEAQRRLRDLIAELIAAHSIDPKEQQGVHDRKTDMTRQYVFGKLRGDLIQELVRKDRESAERARVGTEPPKPAVYRVWPDFPVRRMTNVSITTVKADAARNAFSALGREIVWAVVDSGIDGNHPHFQKHQNLKLEAPLRHCDFTALGRQTEDQSEAAALTDQAGHGTHVAGIVAGTLIANPDGAQNAGQDGAPGAGRDQERAPVKIRATVTQKDETGEGQEKDVWLDGISGMAPACKLISFKVLDAEGKGPVSNLIAACEKIQEINANGRYIKIHGVNMSVGYDFEPSWFACGQSPLCVEVDRLVRSGVIVVVAAGNTGYGWNQSAFLGAVAAGMDLTINDPGNAELAITVGSTHRDMPHVYGVSYFSSKGPTGDGRLKPDLVAPGEKIISCQAGAGPGGGSVGASQAQPGGSTNALTALYKEDSGTSMAAPHVSGVIAAFLSIRREFIGQPERVKEIFLSTATDLRRDRYFQGCGLVDLMRAIQSV
jgi:subtilisin family serine protease